MRSRQFLSSGRLLLSCLVLAGLGCGDDTENPTGQTQNSGGTASGASGAGGAGGGPGGSGTAGAGGAGVGGAAAALKGRVCGKGQPCSDGASCEWGSLESTVTCSSCAGQMFADCKGGGAAAPPSDDASYLCDEQFCTKTDGFGGCTIKDGACTYTITCGPSGATLTGSCPAL